MRMDFGLQVHYSHTVMKARGTHLSFFDLHSARRAASVSTHPMLVDDGQVDFRVFEREVDIPILWHVHRSHRLPGLVHIVHLSY